MDAIEKPAEPESKKLNSFPLFFLLSFMEVASISKYFLQNATLQIFPHFHKFKEKEVEFFQDPD